MSGVGRRRDGPVLETSWALGKGAQGARVGASSLASGGNCRTSGVGAAVGPDRRLRGAAKAPRTVTFVFYVFIVGLVASVPLRKAAHACRAQAALLYALMLAYVVGGASGSVLWYLERRGCQSQLRLIGDGIAACVARNGAMPPDLQWLHRAYIVDEVYLCCPAAARTDPCTGGDTDYYYLPVAVLTGPGAPRRIIACDYRRNHGGRGRNVLFSDYEVVWFTEEEFQADLARPWNAVFARGLGAVEKRRYQRRDGAARVIRP